MKPIDRSQIDNRQIPDAVMSRVIPLLNEAVGRIEALERKLAEMPTKAEPKEATPAKEKPPEEPRRDTDSMYIPDEVPHQDLLKAAGHETMDDLRGANLTSVKGMGPVRAKEVKEWLDAN